MKMATKKTAKARLAPLSDGIGGSSLTLAYRPPRETPRPRVPGILPLRSRRERTRA